MKAPARKPASFLVPLSNHAKPARVWSTDRDSVLAWTDGWKAQIRAVAGKGKSKKKKLLVMSRGNPRVSLPRVLLRLVGTRTTIEHIDGNALNCRRNNLRVVDHDRLPQFKHPPSLLVQCPKRGVIAAGRCLEHQAAFACGVGCAARATKKQIAHIGSIAKAEKAKQAEKAKKSKGTDNSEAPAESTAHGGV